MTINTLDFIFLFRQLSLLLDAGIPFIASLEILCQHQTKAFIIDVIHDLIMGTLSGKTVYDCVKAKPAQFDFLTCRLIQIGEQTGKLSEMLRLIANTKEKHFYFIKKIKQTLTYPCFIFITSTIVVFCLLFFVIPKFSDLFYEKMHLLPMLTRVLFYLSFFLHQYTNIFFLVLAMILCFLLLPFSFLKSARYMVFCKAQQLPRIQSILHKIQLSQIARQIGIMFGAGIDLLSILDVLSESAPRQQVRMAVNLSKNINKGLTFHQAMLATECFPLSMVQMVKIGEETGKLDLMLEHVATLFENEIEQSLHRFISLFEPLIMIILGVLIGGIVIGMYLPLFKLGNFLT